MQYHTHRYRLNQASPDRNEVEKRSEGRWPSAYPPPACNRCRQYKKKCSKALPSCKTCTDAGRKCSYFTSDRLAAASPEVLHARIQWLSQYIEDNIPGATVGKNALPKLEETSPTGNTDREGMESPIYLAEESDDTAENTNSLLTNGPDRGNPKQGGSVIIWRSTETEKLPSLACLNAYFNHVHRAYPFVDKTRIMQAQSVNPDILLIGNDADSLMLYLIHAIGRTTLERAGKITPRIGEDLKMPYSIILQYCTENESLDSVQILVLLTLYSLFDPHGPYPWTIVGMLTRQAMAQGLTLQRPATANLVPVPASDELSNRLFWSVYVLDRMLAASVGQPSGLFVPETHVRLPAVTVDEFASAQRAKISSMLLVTRHVIQLRRLESKITDAVFLCPRGNVRSLTPFDRNVILSELHYEVDNWYSDGCLISRPEASNVRIHDTMAWLNARYYQLLMMLYYPTPFSQPLRPAAHEHLLNIVQKYIHYSHVLFELGQLPLNYITLTRFVPACLVLLYCFGHTTAMVFPAKQEIQSCTVILQSFPSGWTHATSIMQIMTDFAALVSTYESRSASSLVTLQAMPTMGHGAQPPCYPWLVALRTRLVEIGGLIMGKAYCYQYIEGWDTEAAGSCSPAHTSSSADAAVTRHIAALTSPSNGGMGWDFL
ncbi:Zn(II)2Cys6 transcription factor [Aspergillus alliaceus]|uniref:Zn(II)2Cys6 transcription factor n=1 Tax=Petromyces alliaceus TaxID=209559 RepID=UPI0012A4D9A7|nr:fungal-specific transcription factor domain-containing protein [Aspergillus alliaceus]KAB8239540.1 fungal-specific transcription factor domain-containing protein [Aspergillus alliaceus]